MFTTPAHTRASQPRKRAPHHDHTPPPPKQQHGAAADLALLPYHPDDAASVARALALAASPLLPDGLPRLFLELRPAHPTTHTQGETEGEGEGEGEGGAPTAAAPLAAAVREACAARPLHACIVLLGASTSGPEGTAAAAYDALAHEAVAACYDRFRGGGGGKRKGGAWARRGGWDGVGEAIFQAVRAAVKDRDPAVVVAVVGIAALGLFTLVARGGVFGSSRGSARKG